MRQTAGEENFHIFYELIYGADTSLLSTLRLSQDAADYRYVSCFTSLEFHYHSVTMLRFRYAGNCGLSVVSAIYEHFQCHALEAQ